MQSIFSQKPLKDLSPQFINNKLAVMVSGGRSSAFMAHHIFNSPLYKDCEKLFLFCNTGLEKQETISFLKNIKNIWGIPVQVLEGVYSLKKGVGVQSKEVDFENIAMNGEPFAGAIAQMNKYQNIGNPFFGMPYCSDYLKKRVAHHYAKLYFGTTQYSVAIGYRSEDMPKRITPIEIKESKGRLHCPLLTDFERAISAPDLTRFFNKNPFKLTIPSKFGNCELCIKVDNSLNVARIQYGIRSAGFFSKHEKKYRNSFFRDNLTIAQLEALAHSGKQTTLFPDEISTGCTCTF